MMLLLLSLHRVPTPSAARTSLNWVQRISEAFMLLFGLTYAFNLEYPKKLTHTFSYRTFLCVWKTKKPLKPSLLTLKNYLLK